MAFFEKIVQENQCSLIVQVHLTFFWDDDDVDDVVGVEKRKKYFIFLVKRSEIEKRSRDREIEKEYDAD